MKWSRYGIVLIAILALAFAGCSRQSDLFSPDQAAGEQASGQGQFIAPHPAGSSLLATSVTLNGYLVEFDGLTYAGGNTTFFYTVTGMGAEHALSFFFLEIPECAPPLGSYAPPGATIGVDPHTELYGIKWNLSLGTNESRSYSFTFPGQVPLGTIFVGVKASTVVDVGEIPGPCKGFEISGTVYVDADSSGTRNPSDESGISNVTVTLEDAGGNIDRTITDASGHYMFWKGAGTYTIRIDAATAENDFNEQLASSFDPTTAAPLTVTVGPDSQDNEFGFYPITQRIIYDIQMGALLTTGESTKFWKRELRSAINGGKGKSEFDLATMSMFMTEIQGLFLPDPFQFTPGNEFQEAMDIVGTNSRDPVPVLLSELLMAELNHISGKGLVDAPALQSVLLAWAEAVAFEASSSIPVMSGRPMLGVGLDNRIMEATNLLIQMNGSIGGGSGGGG
jgi:hypothetical protein